MDERLQVRGFGIWGPHSPPIFRTPPWTERSLQESHDSRTATPERSTARARRAAPRAVPRDGPVSDSWHASRRRLPFALDHAIAAAAGAKACARQAINGRLQQQRRAHAAWTRGMAGPGAPLGAGGIIDPDATAFSAADARVVGVCMGGACVRVNVFVCKHGVWVCVVVCMHGVACMDAHDLACMRWDAHMGV
eukprot:156346-Chlamydomonas_euryale.AAC.8